MSGRLLLTGAQGFIGREMLSLLRAHREFELHCVSTRPAPAAHPADEHWHAVDLLDQRATHELVRTVKPSHLLHLAWYTKHGAFWNAPENLAWESATTALVRAFAEHDGKRVVAAGTMAEYDWSQPLCDDETEIKATPSTLYGQAKLRTYRSIREIAASASLSLAWGRVFQLFGAQEDAKRFVASIARNLLSGRPAPMSHGNQERDLLYVKDVADAFVALLRSSTTGPVNICSGEGHRLADVARAIARAAHAPADLLQIGAMTAPAGDPPRLVGTCRRLTREVGWQPHYTLERGLSETLADLKQTLAQES